MRARGAALAATRECVGESGRRAARKKKKMRAQRAARKKKEMRAQRAASKKSHAKRDCVAAGDSGRPKAACPRLVDNKGKTSSPVL